MRADRFRLRRPVLSPPELREPQAAERYQLRKSSHTSRQLHRIRSFIDGGASSGVASLPRRLARVPFDPANLGKISHSHCSHDRSDLR